MSAGVPAGYVEAIHDPGEALLVTDGQEFWVPKRAIHPSSQVKKLRDKGRLTVEQWWAEEELCKILATREAKQVAEPIKPRRGRRRA